MDANKPESDDDDSSDEEDASEPVRQFICNVLGKIRSPIVECSDNIQSLNLEGSGNIG